MKANTEAEQGDMSPEYVFDYTMAVRGMYYQRLLEAGANVVVLDPDIARAFRDSAAVNEALRSLLELSDVTQRLTTHAQGADS